jgi:hypothetical protein
MLAAAVAFKRPGAGSPVPIVVGRSALLPIHPPPLGPVGLVFFAAAFVLIERWRARDARAATVAVIESGPARERLAT